MPCSTQVVRALQEAAQAAAEAAAQAREGLGWVVVAARAPDTAAASARAAAAKVRTG